MKQDRRHQRHRRCRPALPLKFYLAAAAIVLALLAIPHVGSCAGHRPRRAGSAREGDRAAGPVGGVVGGAVGAGVGGAVGARRMAYSESRMRALARRCRGFYDRHNRFHCYRSRCSGFRELILGLPGMTLLVPGAALNSSAGSRS